MPTTPVTTTPNTIPPTPDAASNNANATNAFPRIGYVQLDKLQQRGIQAYKDTQCQLARIGDGVTQEAQEIFDALSKTLPCRWAKDTIVVLDEVAITPPYNVENCRANSNAAGSLERVKKVLEGEKRRLASVRRQGSAASV
ncbi:456_t:CDS:2 [Paraglomus occultum]|uniref:455_t:CDS:1 n=1 Tax=Paraglomus occultum TaxID=144539 RepID=A0A9N9FTN4_9GLOM|nr:455_t:CDS:2 [Paraglomus occultum]CAG8555397.1 456_t:CDS:2 [Paraglomus occultum]